MIKSTNQIKEILFEDSYSQLVSVIKLKTKKEINPDNIFIPFFSVLGIDDEALRIHFEDDERNYDDYDVNTCVNEFVESIKSEMEEDREIDKKYDSIYQAVFSILMNNKELDLYNSEDDN